MLIKLIIVAVTLTLSPVTFAQVQVYPLLRAALPTNFICSGQVRQNTSEIVQYDGVALAVDVVRGTIATTGMPFMDDAKRRILWGDNVYISGQLDKNGGAWSFDRTGQFSIIHISDDKQSVIRNAVLNCAATDIPFEPPIFLNPVYPP